MKTNRYVYIFLLLLCMALLYPIKVLARAMRTISSPANVASQQFARSKEIPTNQIIIKYKTPALYNNLSATAQDLQAQHLSQVAGVPLAFERQMSGDAQVFRMAERLPLVQVHSISLRLMTLPEVDYAEPDAILQHTLIPNDPQYSNQWHYLAPSAGNYGINAPAAWDITTGSASIVAAVVDTGITNHADLSGRTVPGYDFINDVQIANDGDGRDSNPSDPGDWITSAESASGFFAGCPVSNSSWHGTHTAGTIGATSNNSLGVTGVNWNSKILPVRVLGKCGGYTSDIVDGMRWAAGLAVTGVPNNPNPAKVINISLGGSGACPTTSQNAINAITAAGTTVVVSAGNNNTNASGFNPANCNGVITVASTDRNGSRAYYSNFGATVEISAPGGAQSFANDPNGILSTLNTGAQGPVADTYIYYQGTSMAAPHVTGVVSLLYSLNPLLTPAQVLQILQNTVTNFPGGSTCTTSSCGPGIVNAGAAVASVSGVATSTPTATSSVTSTPTRTATPTATPTGTVCTNLLADPSFEAYTPNPYWVEGSTNFGTPLCTIADCSNGAGSALPRTGNVWGWFGGIPYDEIASLAQTITIPSGTATLQFYFWIGAAPAGSGTDDVFNAQIDSTTLFSANATQRGSYPGYTFINIDASAFANGGSHTVRFISTTSGQTVNFNLDDVALCTGSGVSTATPTPTRTPLPADMTNILHLPMVQR